MWPAKLRGSFAKLIRRFSDASLVNSMDCFAAVDMSHANSTVIRCDSPPKLHLARIRSVKLVLIHCKLIIRSYIYSFFLFFCVDMRLSVLVEGGMNGAGVNNFQLTYKGLF